MMDRKTPLYDEHVALGGRIVPFAGYLLPVQYSGVIAEHMAVRTAAGLFDVSHMGEVFFEGVDALSNLNTLLTNDFTNMVDGQVRYSPMCNEQGGIVDDLIVYRFNANKYMLVVNASNREKDVDWMRAHRFGECTLEDCSDQLSEIAIQGPASASIMARLIKDEFIPKKNYYFVPDIEIKGIPCLISHTGYTGERGYELYVENQYAPKLWNLLLETGAADGLVPCGLGARDTLRLEAAMPLYGHEMTDDITPLEAGLGWAVKLAKPDFIGKAAIEQRGTNRVRVALRVTGKGIAREHQPVFSDGRQIGETTSGTHLPFLGGAYALALVESAFAAVDTQVEIDVRGRRVGAVVVPQLYKRAK